MRPLTMLSILSIAALGSQAAYAAEPIKVGAIFSVTGGASLLGGPERRTAEMLIEEWNAKGGWLGRKIELIVRDSASEPEKAVAFAKQLIEENKVVAIIGPSTTGETMQIKELCTRNNTLLISCAAAEAIVNPVAPFVFKTPQNDRFAAQKIYAKMQALKIKKIGIVSANDGFGKTGRDQLKKLAPESGITIVADEVYERDATDLTAVVTKLKASGAEAIVNWSIVPAQSILPKNMKQVGFNVPLFQSHGFGNLEYVKAAGDAAEGILFPAGRLLVAAELPAKHPQKALLVAYGQSYEKRYREPASTFGGHAYDALLILDAAIKKAGSAEPEKVRAAVEELRGLVGTAGVFNFSATDHNGLTIDAFEMLTVKNGKFVIAK
jgi:branched-chain amino acid transport system substrate-binding protein